MTTFEIKDESELSSVVQSILSTFSNTKIFLLKGNLGAGKTTLTKAFARHLGYKHHVTSPTYSIVNEYMIDNKTKIYHFDLYRIKSIQELLEIGFEDYAFSSHYCFIEWFEISKNLLPENCCLITVEPTNILRKIEVDFFHPTT